jgi:colanic acid/amylovoran biosynthesis protein
VSQKIYRVVSKPFRLLAEPKTIGYTRLKGQAWFDLVRLSNRHHAIFPVKAFRQTKQFDSVWAKVDNRLQSLLLGRIAPSVSPGWKSAFNALGLEQSHVTTGDEADIQALRSYFDPFIDEKGGWNTRLVRLDQTMAGYSLLYLAEVTHEQRYYTAAQSLASFLITGLKRASDGTLPYDPDSQFVLVDTLGMICPFLARYARITGDQAARDLSVHQLSCFIKENLDPASGLPYHGYQSGGAQRLGLQGWGRGTGWFLLGLIDTIAELPGEHPDAARLSQSFQDTVQFIQRYQRLDGHWSWVILQPVDSIDSSTTALLGYAISRGIQVGLLNLDAFGTARQALHALIHQTMLHGEIDHGLGECRGLGKYPQVYGPQPWLQGAVTAFASIFFAITVDKRTPEIVITNISGLQNRGVEAFLQPTLARITKYLPSADLEIITNTPEYDRRRITPQRARLLPNDLAYNPNLGLGRGIKLLIRQKLNRPEWTEITQTSTAIRRASAVVAMGGDVFSSDYNNLFHHLEPLEYALHHHIPVIFLAQSIGPFKSAEEADAWVRVAERAALITLRESSSYKYVTEDLGLPADKVRLTADPAFLLDPAPKEAVEQLMINSGIPTDQPLIALSISKGISKYRAIDPALHFATWQAVIRCVLEETPAHLVLIPHVQTSYPENDDLTIAGELVHSLGNHPRIHLDRGDYSAAEYKGIISASQMVVAERMHAAFAGFSSHVCTVVIGYSVKARGVLSDLFGADRGYDEYLYPIDEFVGDHDPGRRILSVWDKRVYAQEKLRIITPIMQQRAASNYSILIDTLQSLQAL